MLKDRCCVCGTSKKEIGEKIRAMQGQGVMVVSHDMIAFCPTCDETFCSNHYDLNELAGTHKCRSCGSDLEVERTGYMG